MTSNVHSALQAPLVLVIMMAGLITLYRGRQGAIGSPVDRSPALQFMIGLMLVALAVKQMFWQVFWALRATDALRSTHVVIDSAWIATLLNSVVIIIGAVVCVLASRPILGPAQSTSVVVGALAAVTAASAIMVSR